MITLKIFNIQKKMKLILNIGQFYSGEVIKRPSQYCKTPYVADVIIENEEYMAHTAALGCCGLADKNAKVLMTKVENKKNKCKYKILVSHVFERDENYLVGIDPKMAETIIDNCLKLDYLTNISSNNYEREKTFLNSRFDFTGIDSNGKKFILEVKNVPLADYVDCTLKEKKGLCFKDRKINDKISYFPDGYRKKKNEPVSERAIKHINELKEIKIENNYRTILCFVIQRDDVSSFQPSKIDLFYRKAVQEAVSYGVELMTVVCKWDINGNLYYVKQDLPINVFN